jgi:hypothetical protein
MMKKTGYDEISFPKSQRNNEDKTQTEEVKN